MGIEPLIELLTPSLTLPLQGEGTQRCCRYHNPQKENARGGRAFSWGQLGGQLGLPLSTRRFGGW